jgi:DNA-binding winged helix-turn-helix (wHTH) protein
MHPKHGRLQFGLYVLDLGSRQLLREGAPVHLAPKTWELLHVLAGSGGRVVEKEEILERVWAGVTVEEGNLTQHISLLRKALGDGYIETVPKAGYRFLAPVRALPPAEIRVKRQVGVWALAGLVLSVAGWFWMDREPGQERMWVALFADEAGVGRGEVEEAIAREVASFRRYRVERGTGGDGLACRGRIRLAGERWAIDVEVGEGGKTVWSRTVLFVAGDVAEGAREAARSVHCYLHKREHVDGSRAQCPVENF